MRETFDSMTEIPVGRADQYPPEAEGLDSDLGIVAIEITDLAVDFDCKETGFVTLAATGTDAIPSIEFDLTPAAARLLAIQLLDAARFAGEGHPVVQGPLA